MSNIVSSPVHADELAAGERFEFGANWAHFLERLTEDRIVEAERSLRFMLGTERLDGRTFLDIGSGSGLFSLAARRLGARVHSFDYDPRSVACTAELRRRYFADDPAWVVEPGSVLDEAYIRSLGSFDVVYSWGVLHHTGAMWTALRHAAIPVKPEGTLFVAIYNDQGWLSRMWLRVKRLYNALPRPLRKPLVILVYAPIELVKAAVYACRLDVAGYVRRWTQYEQNRGMSLWHDMVDWAGGLPFEVARAEEIYRLYRDMGFRLQELVTVRSAGCNEYVFRRT